MNMKQFLALLSLLFLAFTPTQDQVRISWDKEHKLTWDDFKGTSKAKSTFVASTNSGLSFNFGYKVIDGKPTTDFNYKVETYFYPELSWFAPGRVNPRILAHEQKHFDISELHARILRKRIAEFNFTTNVKRELDTLYEAVEAERRSMQSQFDLETDHSVIKDQEIAWELKIAELLAEHEPWQ